MTALIAFALAAMADPAPLSPSGKWTLDYGKDACRLSRDYGEGDARITAVFERGGTGEGAAVYFILPRASANVPVGKATIRIEPQGITQQSYFQLWTSNPAKPHSVLRSSLDLDGMAALTSAAVLKVEAGPVKLAVAPDVTVSTLSALSRCNDALLQSWGMDPSERNRIGVKAETTNNKTGMRTDDYPAEALLKSEQGTVTILWEIGIDGRAHNCKVVVSSGSPSLDEASCISVTSRARYRPAVDKDGKPMVTHETRRVDWQLPH